MSLARRRSLAEPVALSDQLVQRELDLHHAPGLVFAIDEHMAASCGRTVQSAVFYQYMLLINKEINSPFALDLIQGTQSGSLIHFDIAVDDFGTE